MALSGKRVLVTGGGGFIGSHLVERLAPANRVTTLDNGRRDALKYVRLEREWGVRAVAGDVLDVPTIRGLVADADIVFHLAAVAGVSSYQKTPVETMTVNMIGTANVLAAAAAANLERVVNFATSEMYGAHADGAREQDPLMPGPPGELRWTYAVSKLAGEHLAMAYHRQHRVPVTSLRPFNIYGPRQVGEGAVRIFIEQALQGRSLTVQGEGTHVRAWCYVGDMIDAALEAAQRPAAIGRCFNIGAPAATLTTLELATRIIALADSSSKVEHVQNPVQAVEMRVPAVDLAREVLGWEPRVDVDTGLRRTIDWYRASWPTT